MFRKAFVNRLLTMLVVLGAFFAAFPLQGICGDPCRFVLELPKKMGT